MSAFPLSKFIFLAFAETIPAVTVDVKLKGFPTANTHSPISNSSLFPNGIDGKFSPSILMTAMSVDGSVPITLASYLELSFKITCISLALSIT